MSESEPVTHGESADSNSNPEPEGNPPPIADLKAKKIASLQARNTVLEAEIAATKAKLEAITKELKYPAAATVRKHIRLLHEYNDIRDVGQGLLGMIADQRSVRISDVYGDFGVDVND